MVDKDKPQESPETSPRFGLELNGIRAAECWFDGQGRLFTRSLTSGVTVCIELLGTVHLGQMLGDEFQPLATFEPQHRDEVEASESETN